MKGLMVTLLIIGGAGTAFSQRYSDNAFQATTTSSSSNAGRQQAQRNQTRLQPLRRSTQDTAFRVAQSSNSSPQSDFRVKSVQTLGGSGYQSEDSSSRELDVQNSRELSNRTATPTARKSDTLNRSQYSDSFPTANDGRPTVDRRSTVSSIGGSRETNRIARPVATSNGNFSSPSSNRTQGLRPQTASQIGSSSVVGPQPRQLPYNLEVSPQWVRQLRQQGYNYSPFDQQAIGRVNQIVLYGGSAALRNPSAAPQVVPRDGWNRHRNTAVIDIDETALRDIENGTLTLPNVGDMGLTGVVLRYVDPSNRKISIQNIAEINPGSALSTNRDHGSSFGDSSPVNFDGPVNNQPTGRLFDRQPNRRGLNGQGWNLNDDPRQQRTIDRFDGQIRETDSGVLYEDSVSTPQTTRQPRFGQRAGDRNLSDSYLDSMRRNRDAFEDVQYRDTRDRDYVRGAINLGRDRLRNGSDDDSRVNTGPLYRDASFVDRQKDNFSNQSDEFHRNFEADARQVRQQMADLQRYEDSLEQRENFMRQQEFILAENKRRQQKFDALAPLPSLTSLANRSPFTSERWANNTIPPWSPDAPVYGSDQAGEQISQLLNARDTKISNTLEALGEKLENLDDKIDDRLDDLNRNQRNGRIGSFAPPGLVEGTMGANLAQARYAYDDRTGGAGAFTRRAPELSINSTNVQRHDRQQNAENQYASFSDKESYQTWMRVILLMLFLSLAANLYLATLSRTLYTQYEELADELRETFSTSSI